MSPPGYHYLGRDPYRSSLRPTIAWLDRLSRPAICRTRKIETCELKRPYRRSKPFHRYKRMMSSCLWFKRQQTRFWSWISKVAYSLCLDESKASLISFPIFSSCSEIFLVSRMGWKSSMNQRGCFFINSSTLLPLTKFPPWILNHRSYIRDSSYLS